MVDATEPMYLIRKGGYYYRPNSQGYTVSKDEAGRYTLKEAINITHPNGPDGPRDGMSYELSAAKEGYDSSECATHGESDNLMGMCCMNTKTAQSAELEALRGEVAPVRHWYESDEHPPRPDAEVLKDIVADLQSDRAENLKLRARVAALEEENAILAAGACDQGDKGMIGDGRGHFYCAMAVENTITRSRLAVLDKGLGGIRDGIILIRMLFELEEECDNRAAELTRHINALLNQNGEAG